MEMMLTMNGFEELKESELMAVDGGKMNGFEVTAGAVLAYTGIFMATGPVSLAVAGASAALYFYSCSRS